jgi:hypothetical protein
VNEEGSVKASKGLSPSSRLVSVKVLEPVNVDTDHALIAVPRLADFVLDALPPGGVLAD